MSPCCTGLEFSLCILFSERANENKRSNKLPPT